MTDETQIAAVYGDSASPTADRIPVSFAYGSIAQAAANKTPGEISFGYDSGANAGAVYKGGDLVSSRVLDVEISDVKDENGEIKGKRAVVKYITTGGQIAEHDFQIADPAFAERLKDEAIKAQKTYGGSEYVDVSDDGTISLKVEDLGNAIAEKIKSDQSLVQQNETVKSLEKSVGEIRSGYLKGAEVSPDTEDDEPAQDLTRTVTLTGAGEEGETATEFEIPSRKFYSDAKNKLDDHEKRIKDNSDAIGEIRNDIAENSGAAEKLDASVASIESNIEKLKSDSSAATAGVEDASGRIAAVESGYVKSASIAVEDEFDDRQYTPEYSKQVTVSVETGAKNEDGEKADRQTAASFDVPTKALYAKVDSLDASAGEAADKQSETDARLDAIENGFLTGAKVRPLDDTDKQMVTLAVGKSDEADGDTESNDVNFRIPSDDFYDKINADKTATDEKISDVSAKADELEKNVAGNSGRIEALEGVNPVTSVRAAEETDEKRTRTVTVVTKSGDGGTEFEVPTERFVETVDASIGSLEDSVGKLGDRLSRTVADVADILQELDQESAAEE